jgi:hypothetical protein
MNGRPDFPLGIALTEFHMLLLYRDRLVAISTLNEQVMYEDCLGQVGALFSFIQTWAIIIYCRNLAKSEASLAIQCPV